jgi:hypothetical protein
MIGPIVAVILLNSPLDVKKELVKEKIGVSIKTEETKISKPLPSIPKMPNGNN